MEYFPDGGEDRVLVLGVLGALEYHFVKPDRVNEQTAVDPFDVFDGHALAVQIQLVDFVTAHRLLVHWLHNDPWDLEVLGVLQGFVDPGLNHRRVQNSS